MGIIATRIRATKLRDGTVLFYPEMLWKSKILFLTFEEWQTATVSISDSHYFSTIEEAEAEIDKRIQFEKDSKKPNPKEVIKEYILEYPVND